MRSNEKHRLRCECCGAIQIVGSRLRNIPVCPECYSPRYIRVKQPDPPKEAPVTSSAAVSQDLEYFTNAQKFIRGYTRQFSGRFHSFVTSLTLEQLQSLGAMPGDMITMLGKLDRMLEGLGLPFEYQQESK